MKDYYKTLGIRATASPEQIHARWIELMRKFHPDRGRIEHEKARKINEAYEVLKHPSARARYDLERTYHRKKRNLYLQRMIVPSIIVTALFIFGLIYFQKPWSTAQLKSVFLWPRASITTILNDLKVPKGLNDLNALNVPNELDDPNAPNALNQTDLIDEIDQTDQTNQPRVAKAKTSAKVPKAVTASNKPKAPNALNQTDLIDEIDQTDQTNQPRVPRAKTSAKVQKAVTASNKPKAPVAPSALNDPNHPNLLSQLTPPPLLATEEEVNQFLDQYSAGYDRKDIEGFLSLFSSRAVQNGRDGFDEIKKMYS
ncbi:MAG: DnaJ domain-containing protein, partial [Proteobacteria bacterium]|nr:DnaJ domain-containing protein [Pseudomonadota bacterium]